MHPDTKYHPTTSIHDNQPANMSDSQVTLRTRKFIRNPLLGRKQMIVCVQSLHRAEQETISAAATHRWKRRTERTKSPKRWNTVG